MKRIKAMIALLFVSCCFFGQETTRTEDNLSTGNIVVLYFKKQSAQIETSFMSNRQAFTFIDSLIAHTPSSIDSITITGFSSPEGGRIMNNRFAETRSANVKSYLQQQYPTLLPNNIHTHSNGEDWEGLRNAVLNDLHIPARRQVLDILDANLSEPVRETKLKSLADGKPYAYIVKNMLHHLRRTTIRIVEKPISTTLPVTVSNPVSISDSVETVEALLPAIAPFTPSVDTTVSPEPALTTSPARSYPFNVALKTNVLYDLVLLPNLEAEVYFKQRWSVNLEFQIAWWKNLSKDRYYQLWMAGPEVRYWLRGDNRFKGHYVGAYASTAVYDLKYNDEGYYSDYCYSAGLSWGYVWPVGKRLAIECGLGVGYVTTQYKKYLRYEPMGRHYYYVSTDRTGYFGPTKAKVALVWRFNIGKKNKSTR